MWDDLVCPIDHGQLQGHGDWLACAKCGRGYPVLDGIPTFLATEEDEAWRRSQCRRAAQLPRHDEDAPVVRSMLVRRRGRALERLVERYLPIGPTTRMLQVGLAREAELHHFRRGVRYGVEPLAGVMAARGLLRWGQVRWVAGRGEELPFPDRHFRVILLGDVLDHVESPGRVLSEARRCLAPEGVLWLTCRTARQGWRIALGRLLGRDEPGVGARSRNRAAAALLRQCRQASLRRLWSAWTDLESGDGLDTGEVQAREGASASPVSSGLVEPSGISEDNPPPILLNARKQYLFHARQANQPADRAVRYRAATAA
jgi:SAM-dependent methyltransferase